MADIGGITKGLGTLISVWGQWQAGRAAKAEGQLQEAAARLEANQRRRAAQQAIVAAQQQALQEQRNAKLLASRALVLSSAGGGDSSDPSISRILFGIADEGFKRAATHMAAGREEARNLRLQAMATQFEGENVAAEGRMRQRAYQTQAGATALKGAQSLYEKYGGQRTKTETSGTGDQALIAFP
jgi:hypothetical protein